MIISQNVVFRDSLYVLIAVRATALTGDGFGPSA